ncbi:MAG: hypothetical protein Q9168_005948 [Polycauliona sp. 1 TL-2023]
MKDSPKPIVLLLGEILQAREEWEGLADLAELRLNNGNREQFLSDCDSGLYRGLLAIARTYDSVEVRVPTSLRTAHLAMPDPATDIDDGLDSSPAALIKS